MKTYITLFLLSISLIGFAQNNKGKNKEKIEALKIAHITNEMSLTSKEAQQFWPIYNEFEAEKHEIRKLEHEKINRKTDLDNLTEEESKVFIVTMMMLEDKKLAHRKAYFKRLEKVLSAKKMIKLIKAERSFKLKMINEYKGRMRGKR